MNDDKYTIESGHLDVGNGHKIYYQRWGNPKAKPTLAFHGGPGSQSSDKHKLVFDPEQHQIIFYDQRGCGQSAAKDFMVYNTIDDLVDDAEKLRKKFRFDKVQLYGFSWGSTMALYYAIKYPKNVSKILFGGVFTGSRAEYDDIHQGVIISKFFPEAWDRYLSIVPEEHRDDTINYYHGVFTTGTDQEKLEHLRRWSQLEASAMSIDSDYTATRHMADSIEDLENLQSTLIFINYNKNNSYLPDRHILNNVHKISHIPSVLVQGRYDSVTPPHIAHQIAKSIGDSCRLHFVPTSHKIENAQREVIRAYTWSFLE